MTLNLATFQKHVTVVAVGYPIKAKNTLKKGTGHKLYQSQLNGHELLSDPRYKDGYKVKIVGGDDTVYLPYADELVCSIPLPPTGATLFVTDNMSGCRFCIGKNTDGSLVAFHANTQAKSSQSDKSGQAVNWQHQDALNKLDKLIGGAKTDTGIKSIVCTCGKAEYLESVKDLTYFEGGTTIVGFHTDGKWSFWFQTYGATTKGGAAKVFQVKNFWKET